MTEKRAINWADLRPRVTSSMVMVPLCLLGLFYIKYAIFILVFLMSKEWVGLIKTRFSSEVSAKQMFYISLFLVSFLNLSLLFFITEETYELPPLLMILGVGGVLFLLLWVGVRSAKIAFITMLGFYYIMYPSFALLELRSHWGVYILYFILIIVVLNDIAAYFIGTKFGKHKLWPAISPSKTWEGLIGGFLMSFACGSMMFFLWDDLYLYNLIFVVIIIIAAISGDLLESAIKRYFWVKDTGHMIPGHGGVLDRVDAFWFAVFIAYIL